MMPKYFKITLVAAVILLPLPAFGQTASYQLGGYAEYMYGNSDIPGIGRVNDHLVHARVNAKLFFSQHIMAAMEVRNRSIFGGSVEKIPDYVSTIRAGHDLGDADVVWWKTHSSVGYSELDRLWIDGTFGKVQVTAGRQRIAWGTSLVWNPSDLFNPLSILDFDYQERPGVDAIRVQYYSGEVSKIEFAVKPGKTSASRIVAGKILFNRWNYDFHFFSGLQGSSPFAGTAWAGDIEGAGFRGEVLIKKISGYTAESAPGLRNALSTALSLSGDYTFIDNTYIHTEVLYNARGAVRRTLLSLALSQSLGLLSPARWSLFQEVSFDLHPLVRASGFVIYNPTDHSSAWVPSVAWSAAENFDVSFYGLIFAGDPLSEYGSYKRSLFLRGKFSF